MPQLHMGAQIYYFFLAVIVLVSMGTTFSSTSPLSSLMPFFFSHYAFLWYDVL